ncbi:RraA family protein [Methylosinus sporium]|nr:RraA family protein [Methylosinus sporium]
MAPFIDRYEPRQIVQFSAELSKLGCAQIYDAAPNYCHPLPAFLTSRGTARTLAGPVFPVSTLNDMLPLLQALDQAPPGWVLYVRNVAPESEALAGDIFMSAMRSQGLSGLVVDGAVRDIGSFDATTPPVFSRSVTFVSAKTAKAPAGETPTTLDYGAYRIEPGDYVVGDADGLLLIKQQYLTAVIVGARHLLAKEFELKERLESGRRLGDLIGLSAFLQGNGPLKFEV